MKRLLLLLSLLFMFSENMAQINSEHLIGTWELINSSSGNALSEKNKNLATVKIISNYAVVTITWDTTTRRVVSTLLGNYRVNPAKGIGHYNDLTSDSCVVEERYWVNDSLTNTTALEKEWFGIKIENHDVMYQTKVNSKERVRWMRSNPIN